MSQCKPLQTREEVMQAHACPQHAVQKPTSLHCEVSAYGGFQVGCPSMTPTQQHMPFRLETLSRFTYALATNQRVVWLYHVSSGRTGSVSLDSCLNFKTTEPRAQGRALFTQNIATIFEC